MTEMSNSANVFYSWPKKGSSMYQERKEGNHWKGDLVEEESDMAYISPNLSVH